MRPTKSALTAINGQWLVISDGGQRARRDQLPSLHQSPITNHQSLRDRPAFTLTEVLVVITILAILAALGTVGIMRALDTAKQSRIKIELDNIDAALKSYKDKYGSYPPSNITTSNMAAVAAHVVRAFPRYNLGPNNMNLTKDLQTAGFDLAVYRPDQALVFWLRGFSPDVTNPFLAWKSPTQAIQIINGATPTPNVTVDVTPLFNFDPTRLKVLVMPTSGGPATGAASYIPPGVKNNVPYVYFNSASYGEPGYPTPLGRPYYWDTSFAWDPDKNVNLSSTGVGFPAPYIVDQDQNGTLGIGTDDFANPDTFQLIACGMDGLYANPMASIPIQRLYPTGVPYDILGDDNVTNFCDKSRMGDAKP